MNDTRKKHKRHQKKGKTKIETKLFFEQKFAKSKKKYPPRTRKQRKKEKHGKHTALKKKTENNEIKKRFSEDIFFQKIFFQKKKTKK